MNKYYCQQLQIFSEKVNSKDFPALKPLMLRKKKSSNWFVAENETSDYNIILCYVRKPNCVFSFVSVNGLHE